MTTVIDRRPQTQSKSVINRDRFLKRHQKAIRKSIATSPSKSLKDFDTEGAEVSIPGKDLDEPSIRTGKKGEWEHVTTGNKKYQKGDRVAKPYEGDGSGQDGDPMDDDFLFTLTKDEFANIFFEGLALPNLIEKDKSLDETSYKHAGFSTDGTANNLHLVRSMRNAIGRRIALGAPIKKEIDDLMAKASDAEGNNDPVAADIYGRRLSALDNKLAHVAFLDPIDLRYS